LANRRQWIRVRGSPGRYSRVAWNSTPGPPLSVGCVPARSGVTDPSSRSDSGDRQATVASPATATVSVRTADPASERIRTTAGSNANSPRLATSVYVTVADSPGRSVAFSRGGPPVTVSSAGTPSTTRTSGSVASPSFVTDSVTRTRSPGVGLASWTVRSTRTAASDGTVDSPPERTYPRGTSVATSNSGDVYRNPSATSDSAATAPTRQRGRRASVTPHPQGASRRGRGLRAPRPSGRYVARVRARVPASV